MAEDRLLEILESGAGVETELVDEACPGRAVNLERVGLTAAAVEREHLERPEPFAQGMRCGQLLQLSDRLAVAPAGQVGVDPPFERREPQLVEPGRRRPKHVTVGDVGERLAAPQRERLAQQLRRFLGMAVFERACTVRREPLEPVQVERARIDTEQIPGIACLDGALAECLAKLRDIALQDVGGGVRRVVAPDRVDQPVRGHHLSRVEEQDGEHRALPGAQACRATVDHRLDRPEHPELRLHPGRRYHRGGHAPSLLKGSYSVTAAISKRCFGSCPHRTRHRVASRVRRAGDENSQPDLPGGCRGRGCGRRHGCRDRRRGAPIALKGTQTIVDEKQGKFEMQGSLVGKWNVTAFSPHYEGSNGGYAATGKEIFTGCHDVDGSGTCDAGEPAGTLRFTFVYWATFNPMTQALVRGECVHPIVGGTGNFAKAKGFVHMWDRPVGKSVKTTYAGTLELAGRTTTSRMTSASRSLSGRGSRPTCGG